jgi:hypothetical protein
MKWAACVACIGQNENACGVLMGKPKKSDHLEDPGINGRSMLKFVLKKEDGSVDRINLAQDRFL